MSREAVRMQDVHEVMPQASTELQEKRKKIKSRCRASVITKDEDILLE
jgi:hypothetical protein